MRSYDMAEDSRLSAKWNTFTRTADGTIRYALAALRNRARELEENDPYIARYFQLLETNVVGDTGISLVPEPPTIRNATVIDKFAAGRISRGFSEWCKLGTPTVCGRYSFTDLQKRILRSVPTDGELFLNLIYGAAAGNRFDFAIEVLEADLLDENYSTELQNGNVIRMGVELDPNRRPVAYHFLTSAPGDYMYPSSSSRARTRRRIPAESVIHCAARSRMRPGQTRAITWFAPVGPQLYQLHAYRKAEAVAARVGSEKMGFYTAPSGEGFEGDHDDVDPDEFIQQSEAGAFEILPEGWKVEPWNPDHPSTAFEPFNKAMTRTASAGLGVSYNDLASDLEGVSYSSMRSGSLNDRAHYRTLQSFLVESCGLADRIYPEWLRQSLLSGAVKLNPADFDRLSRHRWQRRGWPWVDPMKEGQGNKLATESGTKLVSDVVAETSGRTIDEHIEALTIERQKFAAAGLVHPTEAPSAPSQSQKPAEPAEPDDDAGQEDTKE